jgi:hypothetical protein
MEGEIESLRLQLQQNEDDLAKAAHFGNLLVTECLGLRFATPSSCSNFRAQLDEANQQLKESASHVEVRALSPGLRDSV